MPLTADRATPWRAGENYEDPVAAATVIHAGALVMLDASGNAVPGDEDDTLTARGVAQEHVDNSAGAAGAKRVKVLGGTFRFHSEDITRAHIGAAAYVIDDETVSSSSDDGARPAAGIIVDVETAGVWVKVGAPPVINVTVESN